MSNTTTRRLLAVLLALLVACSFAGAPAIAAAGSDSSVEDGVSSAFGSDDDTSDGNSTDSNSTDDGSTGEESADDADEESATDDAGGTDETDDASDRERDDDTAENVTEAVDETVNATTETIDGAAETVDGTTSGTAYRTFELIESTTDATDEQGSVGLPFDGTEGAESVPVDANEPNTRLSVREPATESDDRSSDDASDAYDAERAVASIGPDEPAALSAGASGGQPVPADAGGGVALGLGAIAAAAAVRSTPLVGAASGSGAGTAATGYLSSLLEKIKPFVFPLRYSRYDDSDPLEHEARERVYEIVDATPGSYLSAVSERADLPLSTTRHHMKVLEREGLVSGAKLRGKRRFYPAYTEDIELAAALNDDATADVIDALARLGAASVSDLADDLGRDPSTVSHHLQRLEEDGIVTRNREGRAVMNELAAEARDILEPETAPRPGEAADAAAD
ncbi:winged helix-turn-helix transcriptional regulator [Natronomonas marina]|jgi:DNA-binding transcriptional ArsR family regulator|uniref:winged helix-turn-helix transcriptional regulator n=1 Tax=Natronomonas marina TaxID=2961939 RepID=UPI0020C99A9D|nr:helix-turn-helix domain-containing protein [Natronomonas marina]